jgi:hypothetical protein
LRAVPRPRATAGIPPPVGRLPLPTPTGAGQPLPPSVAGPLQTSLGVDVSHVRVHTGAAAAEAAASVGARAFALGHRIVLGRGERATDLALMAHEVAHVVQQRGAAALQRWTSRGGDAHEREAQSASAAAVRGERFTVRERTAPRLQRLGIGDALDYLADKANLIPGFRMFTIILGVNPVNMSRVDRSAANILRAVIEFMPGGGLITQALDSHGVFDKVGAWVEREIRALGLSGASFRKAIDQFIDSLSWRDIFDLGDVWDRAKRIFTDPIGKLIDFAARLVGGIVKLIKEAILRPLAKLAEGTRGYPLLKAVLGTDPITGDAVPRTAETLIGGFMTLIGKQEVWQNIKKANAIPRAWAWFQGALAELLAFVRQIPGRFVAALTSLELVDIVVLPRAFLKVGRVFAGIAGDFIAWGLKQVLSLLQIIFEVLAPAVMPYLRKAMGAFRTIIANPVRFVGHLVKAGVTGFGQFAKNFLSHLRTALIQWLTGTLSGAGLYIPQAFEIREIIKFVLSVLGLTWQNVRAKLVKAVGESAVAALEKAFDIVVTLVKEGPAAAWEKIREQLTNLKELVMEQVMAYVRESIVRAAIRKIVTSLNPAGAFIQAILAIYNTVMFVVERLSQIGKVVAAFVDSIAAIAAGAIAAAANRVEQTMAGLLTLVVSFLARFAGLGKVSDAVLGIVRKLRAPIDKALDKVVEWIVGTAQRVGRFVVAGTRRLSQGLVGLLRVRKTVKLNNGEQHSLYFRQRERRMELTLASNPVAFRDFVNRIGNRPALQADKDYAILLINRIDQLEDAALATNVDNTAAIVTLLEELGRTATSLMNRAYQLDVRSAPPIFAGLRDGFGRGMRVMLVTDDLRRGSRPSITDPIWQDLNLRRSGAGSYYVLGHLLNEKLSGPGTTPENLTPLSRSGNAEHESKVESIIKPTPGIVPRAFLYVVTPAYGRTLNTGVIGRINLPTNPDNVAVKALKNRIVMAERHVPTMLVCSIREIDPLSGRNTGMAETYSIPNQIDQGAPEDYQV